MSRGHQGWNDTFDRQFDDRAVWFHLQNERGKHLAAARLIFRRLNGHEGPLPSDLGDLAAFMPPDDGSTALSARGATLSTAVLPGSARPDCGADAGGGGGAVATASPPICEASGMSFKSRKHLALLLPGYMRWMQDRGLGPVYSLYDPTNDFVNWLQCQLLLFRHVRGATVAFDGFRYKDGDPVTWQATVLDPLLRLQSVANAQRNRREVWEGQAPKVAIVDRVAADALRPIPVPQPAASGSPALPNASAPPSA